MLETQDNFKVTKSNVTPLRSEKTYSSTVPRQINDIMKSRVNTEDFIMPQETYSKAEIDLKLDKISSDIDHGFDKVDLKFEKLEQKIDSGFKQVDLKFDNFERRIENMFADLKIDLSKEKIETLEREKKDKRELILWSIGTAVAILAIIIPLLLQKK